MDASPTPRSENAGPWVDYDTFVGNVWTRMRAIGLLPSKTVLEDLTASMLEGIYGTPAGIAEAIGGSLTFQDTSPPRKPGNSARYRLDFPGLEPRVFEDLGAFNNWLAENKPTLMAWAERKRLAGAAAAPTAEASFRKSRAL
jgi:hypothetical protein